MEPVHAVDCDLGEDCSCGAGDELARPVFDRLEALAALPDDLVLAEGVNLDADDPALDDETGRRYCVAARRAGGRCTAPPKLIGLLCTVHSGDLNPADGGRAKARMLRDRGVDAEELARMVRAGARSVIAEELHSDPVQLRLVIRTLRGMAAAGDVGAAKALIPFLNQGLGMPTETMVVSQPTSADEVRDLPTAQLVELVARGRARRMNSGETATRETG